MGQVTSLFAWKVAAQIECAADRAALLRSVGIDPDGPVDPARMLPDDAYYAFFERAARADPDGTALPLRVGASMRADEYGAFGLAWKSAPSLRGSYERAERYARVLTSVTRYELHEAGPEVQMLLHREGERRLGLRLSNEASIASIMAISQQVTTARFQPSAVHFKHPAPESVAGHRAHFGCPVHFASDIDALCVPREQLREPNRLGDPAIARFFDAHLEAELSGLGDDASLEQRVRIQVAQCLSEGIPAISDIAGRLGTSARTLQRRLSDRGLSYQGLVDAARRELAERLLRDTGYPLAEIAFLTGFSEQSAFNRAFKRWAGQTPRSYRLEASPPGG